MEICIATIIRVSWVFFKFFFTGKSQTSSHDETHSWLLLYLPAAVRVNP